MEKLRKFEYFPREVRRRHLSCLVSPSFFQENTPKSRKLHLLFYRKRLISASARRLRRSAKRVGVYKNDKCSWSVHAKPRFPSHRKTGISPCFRRKMPGRANGFSSRKMEKRFLKISETGVFWESFCPRKHFFVFETADRPCSGCRPGENEGFMEIQKIRRRIFHSPERGTEIDFSEKKYPDRRANQIARRNLPFHPSVKNALKLW